MQTKAADTSAHEFTFQDARDLHGPHAGQRLSAESLQLLTRLAACAQRLGSLHLPPTPMALPTEAAQE